MDAHRTEEEVFSFLSGVPAFSGLPEPEIRAMSRHAGKMRYSKGETVFQQGRSIVDQVLVIKRGSLELYFDREDEKILSGKLKPGDVFGGISILMNHGVSIRTLTACEDVEGYTIPAKLFIEICNRHDDFHNIFVNAFHERMRDQSYAALVEIGQKIHFLSGVEPFSFLPETELAEIAGEIYPVHYEKDIILFYQGRSVVNHLYIIYKGAAERYYEEFSQKTLRGRLGEGDTYGGISMLVNDGISVRTFCTIEETDFYTLSKERFISLCQEHDVFREYFTETFGRRMLDRTYADIIRGPASARDEASRFFNLRVDDICHSTLLSCPDHTSIRDAATSMAQKNYSSILISARDGTYKGVVTDSDLRGKVVAGGLDTSRPVAAIMSSPLVAISASAMVSEALLEMMETNLKHLAVKDSTGRVFGIITNRDLLAAQGQSAVFILQEINMAESLDEIIQIQKKLPLLARNMINGGAKSRTVTRLITRITDGITKKLIQLAMDDLGAAPCEFAFMVMGSEGRMEQTLKTDQDNAIIFEDPPQSEIEACHRYFRQLGEKVSAWLDMAGYAFCKGDIMARNPKWCQPLSKWKQHFHKWIRVSTPTDLLQSAIFFDFRRGHGKAELVDDLRLFLFDALEGWSRFFRDLTQNALGFRPPIGFFRNFLVESRGEHRNKFDIKSAMTPIVDFARIYALYHNISETNTQERLYQLHLRKILNHEIYMEVDQAYDFLMQQRLTCQIDAIEAGLPPNNYINPKQLSRIEQTMLKEIFKRIEGLQTKLNLDFAGSA
jgi:CBS domain-containing protein